MPYNFWSIQPPQELLSCSVPSPSSTGTLTDSFHKARLSRTSSQMKTLRSLTLRRASHSLKRIRDKETDSVVACKTRVKITTSTRSASLMWSLSTIDYKSSSRLRTTQMVMNKTLAVWYWPIRELLLSTGVIKMAQWLVIMTTVDMKMTSIYPAESLSTPSRNIRHAIDLARSAISNKMTKTGTRPLQLVSMKRVRLMMILTIAQAVSMMDKVTHFKKELVSSVSQMQINQSNPNSQLNIKRPL